MRIKKGDNVQVLSGNDKGKTGEVLEVMPKEDKVIVKGINVRKKHVKARKQGEESGIIPVECSIPVSKINVVCPKCGKATRVGYSVEKDQKVRILPRGQNDGTEAVVRTAMTSISDPGKPEVQIIYRLRNLKDQGWKVIDVNVEGVWLVSNYRNQYGSIAAQEGIGGLIRRMEERLANPEASKK